MRQWGASPADIDSLTNAPQLGCILGGQLMRATATSSLIPFSY